MSVRHGGKWLRRVAVGGIFLFVASPAMSLTLHADTAHALSGSWNNASSGNWSVGTNWDSGVAPNSSTDNATFPHLSGGSHSVTVDGTFSVHNLNLTSNSGDMYNFSGGQLQLFGSMSVGSGQNIFLGTPIAFQNDTTLTIDPSSTVSPSGSGVLSGNHGLTLAGGGQIYFLSPATYTGMTTITDGDFSAGLPNEFSPSSAYVLADSANAILEPGGSDQTIASLSGGAASQVYLEGAVLTVGDATDTTYAGSITDFGAGGGGLTKQGTGKLTLTGTSTYTGPTIVNAGTLDVNGSITNSAITVNSGGTLKGSGTLNSITMNGLVAPGNSIGTLHAGTFALGNGSTFENEINPSGGADLIDATTSISIGSGVTLNVVPQAGTYAAGQTYTILSAPNITGTFSSITSTSNALTYQLKYYPTHVDLVVSNASSPVTTSGSTASALPPSTGFGAPAKTNLTTDGMFVASLMFLAIGLVKSYRRFPSFKPNK